MKPSGQHLNPNNNTVNKSNPVCMFNISAAAAMVASADVINRNVRVLVFRYSNRSPAKGGAMTFAAASAPTKTPTQSVLNPRSLK